MRSAVTVIVGNSVLSCGLGSSETETSACAYTGSRAANSREYLKCVMGFPLRVGVRWGCAFDILIEGAGCF